jgi:hypothetical protein
VSLYPHPPLGGGGGTKPRKEKMTETNWDEELKKLTSSDDANKIQWQEFLFEATRICEAWLVDFDERVNEGWLKEEGLDEETRDVIRHMGLGMNLGLCGINNDGDIAKDLNEKLRALRSRIEQTKNYLWGGDEDDN